MANSVVYLAKFAWFGRNPNHPAYVQDPEAFKRLADLAAHETWGEDDRILKSYIEHTFSKAMECGSLVRCKHVAYFDTNLQTACGERIYCYFVRAQRPNPCPVDFREWMFGDWLLGHPSDSSVHVNSLRRTISELGTNRAGLVGARACSRYLKKYSGRAAFFFAQRVAAGRVRPQARNSRRVSAHPGW